MKILSWRNDLKLNVARCFTGTHATVRVTEEAVVTSGSCVECVLTWAMSKWRKTVGLSMKSRIKSLSWRKDLKLNDVEVKTLSWRKDLKLNAARCFSGTHATVRVTEEAVVTSGSCVECVLTWAMSKWRKTVGLSMKSRIKSLSWRKDLKLNDVEVKTLSWRKDLKLNAARCFSGTRATVRFSKETVVTSGSRVKRVLTRAISKLTKHVVTFNEEEDEDTLVEEVLQLNAARCFSGTHATARFTRETVASDSRVKRPGRCQSGKRHCDLQ